MVTFIYLPNIDKVLNLAPHHSIQCPGQKNKDGIVPAGISQSPGEEYKHVSKYHGFSDRSIYRVRVVHFDWGRGFL